MTHKLHCGITFCHLFPSVTGLTPGGVLLAAAEIGTQDYKAGSTPTQAWNYLWTFITSVK
jgi:hypothetical protein